MDVRLQIYGRTSIENGCKNVVIFDYYLSENINFYIARERLMRESKSERFKTAPSSANINNQNVSYLTISLAFVHMCLGHVSIDSACLLQSCRQFQVRKEKSV